MISCPRPITNFCLPPTPSLVNGASVHTSFGGPALSDEVRFQVVLNEETAIRRAEEALALERARRQAFVSTLAHELRQPLSALLIAVEAVRLAPERAAEVMKRQIGQMSRLVEDLVDSTRWALGRMALKTELVDVRQVVRTAALDARPGVEAHGHEFVVTSGSEPLWIHADPQRLQQVLSNLLVNATRYTDVGGRISLSAERQAGTVALRLTDTGRGIAPNVLPHLFDLFSQVQPLGGPGLGIGLSIVREIVTLHGGHVEVRSPGLGKGSEFIVTLPLAPPVAQRLPEYSTPTSYLAAGRNAPRRTSRADVVRHHVHRTVHRAPPHRRGAGLPLTCATIASVPRTRPRFAAPARTCSRVPCLTPQR